MISKLTNTTATAPVAPEIIPGFTTYQCSVTKPSIKAVYKPTVGETPAINEKPMASGIRTTATTKPDNTYDLIFLPMKFSYNLTNFFPSF